MATPPGPEVSVLLPVRDGAGTLAACLETVRRQVGVEWECVVVDDGSRDETANIARRYRSMDDRFRVLPRPRLGLVAALNAGIGACRATIVARMDADDLMRRDRLRLQIAALRERPDLAAVGAHVRIAPRTALGPGTRAYEAWINHMATPESVDRERFIECPVAHPTLAIRAEVLGAYRYADLPWPEDYDLVLRMLADGRRIGIVPRRLLTWRIVPDRASRRDPRYGIDRFIRCKATYLASGPLRDVEGYVLWGYGGTGRALAAELAKLGKHPVAIVELHAGRVGMRIRDAPVIAPEALDPSVHRPLVASVAGAAPRARIRRFLEERGMRELRDFVCAA